MFLRRVLKSDIFFDISTANNVSSFMEFINFITSFFQNKSIKRRSKTLIVLGICVLLLMLNDITGFTYYYTSARKVEQVARISEALNDTSLTLTMRAQLKQMRVNILNRKSTTSGLFPIISKPYHFFSNRLTIDDTNRIGSNAISNSSANHIADTNISMVAIIPKIIDHTKHITADSTSTTPPPEISSTRNPAEISAVNDDEARNNIILFLCSSIVPFFVSFIYFISTGIRGFKKVNGKRRSLHILLGIIVTIVIFFMLALPLYWVMGLIFSSPILGQWNITYVAVSAIPIILLVFLFIRSYSKIKPYP